MLDMEKIQKARKLGAIWGYRWQYFKSFILWYLPWFRKKVYKHKNLMKAKVIREFVESFNAFKEVHLVACDECQPYGSQVGIDWKSEEYGWNYKGGHMWSCPKCKEK